MVIGVIVVDTGVGVDVDTDISVGVSVSDPLVAANDKGDISELVDEVTEEELG